MRSRHGYSPFVLLDTTNVYYIKQLYEHCFAFRQCCEVVCDVNTKLLTKFRYNFVRQKGEHDGE
ncbi:hypothetical protein KVMX100_70130 [Klebsiella variicola]|nr:hypothetical protein KVMX100_70130 [Klebsiella variicola]